MYGRRASQRTDAGVSDVSQESDVDDSVDAEFSPESEESDAAVSVAPVRSRVREGSDARVSAGSRVSSRVREGTDASVSAGSRVSSRVREGTDARVSAASRVSSRVREGSDGRVSAARVSKGTRGGGVRRGAVASDGALLLDSLPLEEGETSQQQAGANAARASRKKNTVARNKRFNQAEKTALVTGIVAKYDQLCGHLVARTSSTIRRQLWKEIRVSVSACGNQVRTLKNCRKKIDDIRRNLKNAIQFGRRHASGTGGGPPASPITLTPLEEMLRDKMLPVVISGLHGDRDIGVYPQIFPPVTPVPPNNQEEVLTSDSSLASSILEGIASEQHQSPIVTQAATLPPANNTQETLKAMDASESRISVLHIKHHQELMGVHQCMAVEMHKIQDM